MADHGWPRSKTWLTAFAIVAGGISLSGLALLYDWQAAAYLIAVAAAIGALYWLFGRNLNLPPL